MRLTGAALISVLWTVDFQTLPSTAVTFPVFTRVPTDTAWWQRHKGVNNLPQVVVITSLI